MTFLNKLIVVLAIASLVAASSISSYAQEVQRKSTHIIELNTRVPYYFGIGYEFSPQGNFSFRLRGGYLTSPYDQALFDIIPFDEDFDASLSSFKHGLITELGVAYEYRKNRITIGIQHANLHGELGSVTDLQPLFENELPVLDFIIPIVSPLLEGSVEMNNKVYVASIGYERLIPLGHPKWELLAGLTFNKYVGSSDITTTSENGIVNEYYHLVEDIVNKKTKTQFEEYFYFPTIDIALRYKFKLPAKKS